MNIIKALHNLAKDTNTQNIFQASKEISGIYLFENRVNFTKIQNVFMELLYTYESLRKDIIIEKISAKVLDDEMYMEAYLKWKRSDKRNRQKEEKKDQKTGNLKLAPSNKIIFPTAEKK